jgi:hypothetical protein
MENDKLKKLIKTTIREFLNENVNNNLSDEWTYDIVEYLQGYYGISKNYNKLYKLIKEVVDMGLRAKSFNSFREFLDYHNPKYHETNTYNKTTIF